MTTEEEDDYEGGEDIGHFRVMKLTEQSFDVTIPIFFVYRF